MIDPFVGGYRDDVRFGSLRAELINMWKQKGDTLTQPDDLLLFDPDAESEPTTVQASKQQSPEQIMAHLKAMTRAMGGKVTEKDSDGDDR